MDVQALIKQLTLEEKAALCSGKTFWSTKDIEHLGIPSLFVCDGPHGLRKQEKKGDNLGVVKSEPATCFPTACAIGSSWDVDLIESVGRAIGKEALASKVDIVLGPGVNIKRSPLCGRNFEYYSEDPYLTGKLGTAIVKGIQSQGVGTSLKHFAVNNQENERMTLSSNVDMRTMREIYLQAFEMIIKEEQPYTVMCSYNRINGEHASDSKILLTDILRDAWGFEGFVVTDWGALNNKLRAIEAGCDLEMPTSNGINDIKLVEAVKSGELDIEFLDASVEKILNIVDKCVQARRVDAVYDIEEHHQLARKAASESMVLLKNEDKLLPLDKEDKIVVIGEFAKETRYQGGGSSYVNAHKVLNAFDELCKISEVKVNYSKGYSINTDEVEEELLHDAIKQAQQADKVIYFIGLPDIYESEGYDRKHIHYPNNQLKVLEEISKVNKRIVVLMYNGAVVEIKSWKDQAKSIVECWLGGQAVGGAVADVLYGKVNPSGRLGESFPLRLEDNPSYLSFEPFNNEVNYGEGIYVGYRYYESIKREVAFPFGFGLSYTTFEYSNIKVNTREAKSNDSFMVTLDVTNTGKRFGKEVIQLYIGKEKGTVAVPEVQLRSFKKVGLEADETKQVTFDLSMRDFAYFDIRRNAFAVETNDYFIRIASDCQHIILEEKVHVISEDPIYYEKAYPNSKLGDLLLNPMMEEVLKPVMTMLGEFFRSGAEAEVLSNKMIENTIRNLTLRALVNFTGGQFSEENMHQVIQLFNTQE